MKDLLMFAVAWCTAVAGFFSLALAMDRHFEDWFGRGRGPARARLPLRTAGISGLLASLLACLATHGSSQGWVLWFGVMTAAAIVVVLALSRNKTDKSGFKR